MKLLTEKPLRKAGRPRTFDREQALRKAMELFWRQGFEATSTAQLTSELGISPPSLYAAFGPKEQLFREAVGMYLAQYTEFVRGPLMSDASIHEVLERILFGAAEQYSQSSHPPGCMIACGELQASDENAALAKEIADLRRGTQMAICARLQSACDSGELPKETDVQVLSSYIAMIGQGMAVQARDGASLTMLKQLAQMALSALPPSSERIRS